MVAALLGETESVLRDVPDISDVHVVRSLLEVHGVLGADGALALTSVFTFDGSAPDTLVQRIAASADGRGTIRYDYQVTGIKAVSGGRELAVSVTTHSDPAGIGFSGRSIAEKARWPAIARKITASSP